MARISYEDFENQQNQQPANPVFTAGSHQTNYVRYFSLKNDGDEAIVRFMYENASQFDILTVHTTKLNNWDRKISCIRDPREPINNCPFCKAGRKVEQKFFIKLIEYTKDEHGNVVATPKIWERSAIYVKTLKSFMDEYSPISDYVFKIKRAGKAGDKSTTYTILPCNPAVYSPAVYKKDESLFSNYKVLGNFVLDKNFDEMYAMLGGTTQQEPQATQPQTQQQYTQPQQTYTAPTQRQYTPQSQAPQSQQRPVDTPWGSNQTQTGFTPRRYPTNN